MHRGTKRVLLVVLAVAAAAAAALLLRPGGGGGGRRVVLYTAHSQDAIDLLVPRLRQDTGLEAEVIPAGSGEVVQRLRAERDRPRCDVVFGLAGDQLEGCADLLAEHTPAEVDRLAPTLRVGTRWQPYTSLLLVLMVNTERLPPDQAPKGWADLAHPRLRGQVSSARADTSGSSYMQLRTILQVFGPGEPGWDVYGRFLQNVVFAPGSAAVPRLVNDGEAAVGVTLEDSALRYVRGGGPVRIVYPVEGTVAAPDGIALVAGAPHQADARLFIDWALSKPIQDLLADKLGRRSARTDAAPIANLPALAQLKTLPYDFGRAASEKEPTIERWTKLVSELGR
jgi:iron(III) transport system substrate-binding protein